MGAREACGKTDWTIAQLLPEGLSADGAALSQGGAEASIYDLDVRALSRGMRSGSAAEFLGTGVKDS